MCQGCEKWTHSSCMGYSHGIFKFLERAANVKFLCNGCLSADIRPKSTVDVGELSQGIEDIKESLEIIKSWPTCNPSPPTWKLSILVSLNLVPIYLKNCDLVVGRKLAWVLTAKLINRIFLSTMKK